MAHSTICLNKMAPIPFSQFKTSSPKPVAPQASSKVVPFSQFKSVSSKAPAPAPASKPASTGSKVAKFFETLIPATQGFTKEGQQRAVNQGKGFVKGSLKQAISIASMAQGAGKDVLGVAGVDTSNLGTPALDSSTPQGQGVQSRLKDSNPDQQEGDIASNIAGLAVGGESAEGEKVVQKAKEVAGKGGDLAKTLALGKEGVETLERLGNEETQKFIKGKTFSDVVDHVTTAVKKFADDSKSALRAVKDKLPNDNTIDAEGIKTKVEKTVTDFFNKGAEYKGIVQRNFESINDLISKNLLKPDEAKTVQGMMDFISQWKDFSSRGVLNLKEGLEAFRGTTEADLKTNSILNKIGGTLKDVVADSVNSPEIKTALKTASGNIEKGEDFVRTLIGKNAQQGETRLSQIVRGLKNPAANADKLKLIQDLENATGEKILSELKGYSGYLDHLGSDLKTTADVVGRGVKRVGGAILGTGVGVEAVRGLKSIF